MVSYKKYTYLIGALGFGLFFPCIQNFGLGKISPGKYIIFLLLMILSELQTIKINNSHFSMDFCFAYSSIFIFGPVPTALMKVLSTLICQIYYKIKNICDDHAARIIFKTGQYMISFFCAAGLYSFIKSSCVWEYPFYEIMLQSVAILVYFLLNNLLLQCFLALKYNKNVFGNVLELLLLDFSTYLMAVPFGVTTVIMHNNNGFPQALLVLAVYLAVVYIYILYIDVKSANRELTALYNMSVTITSTLDVDMVMDIVLSSVQSIVPWDTACLYVYQNGWLVPAIYEGYSNEDFNKLKLKQSQKESGFSLFKEGKIINNCHKDHRLKELYFCSDDTKSIMVVPLVTNKELIGGIVITSYKDNIYNQKHLTLLSILASQAAVALKNAQLFDETAKLAISDGLTGLYNHMYLYSELERQMEDAKTTGGIFSLIIIDVDYFKTYNDMYGHITGDTILKNLADILKKNVRDKDTLGRYGGEEFAIILPGIQPFEAMKIAERIRKVVESTPLARVGNKNIFITISAGIASYPTDAVSIEDLVNKADKAMIFGAKQKGRNKVVMFRPNMNVEN
ncbi:MAG: GGDEF domain-containing protein [Thermoanaerobacteraceae bacterium]|nr:GGDEF domain-containing protein [Thermoanaerobacteraceae bacterium]